MVLIDDATRFARVAADRGKPLVYIDYLESAPWNWKIGKIEQEGGFKSVGATLFAVAVGHSLREGFHGRVGLHALPQTEPLYQAWGLEPFGPGPSYGRLAYFELTRDAATKWGNTA